MKFRLELIVHEAPYGRKFLNHWESGTSCEIIGDKLLKSNFDEDGNELLETEITFLEFVSLVENSNDD